MASATTVLRPVRTNHSAASQFSRIEPARSGTKRTSHMP